MGAVACVRVCMWVTQVALLSVLRYGSTWGYIWGDYVCVCTMYMCWCVVCTHVCVGEWCVRVFMWVTHIALLSRGYDSEMGVEQERVCVCWYSVLELRCLYEGV